MSVTPSRINTKGAIVTIGGFVLNIPDGNGIYWDTISGIDIGCTSGGVTVSYNFEKNDIFCDQSLAAVSSSIISETATVSFTMLEADVENLQYAIQQCNYALDAGVTKSISVGGVTSITYVPLKLEVADQTTGNLTTWTFFKVLTDGIEINFERDNVTGAVVTFTAYADTTYPDGYNLFSVVEDIS